MRPAWLILASVLFVAGFLAACGSGGAHPIKPGETIKLRHPATIDGRTFTSVVISPTVRTTE